MRIEVFASGSKGNVLAFSCRGGFYLVDMGLSCRELMRRMKLCHINMDYLKGVFFTHDHCDHCQGLKTFHKVFPHVALYANSNTADAIAATTSVDDGWGVFETGEIFALGDMRITSFSIPHDAADPVGYLFEEGEAKLFVGTDMGYPTLPTQEALQRATCAVLESNHDPELLEQSSRPFSLKQRIAGRSGHLSNEQAAALIRSLNPPHLKTLLLAHLSGECNRPHLARHAMQETLDDLGRTDVTLETLSQTEPSAIYTC